MAFKPSASKKNDTTGDAKLNLNSMMDVMTIILLFLLKSFSSGEIVTMDEKLTLPDSSVRLGKPPKVVNVIASSDVIDVRGAVVGKVPEILANNEQTIPGLLAALQKEVNEAQDLEAEFGTEFTGEIVIQADKNAQFKLMFKLLASASLAGFDKIRFMTIEGSGPPL